MTTDLHLNGALGKNMMPLFPALSGGGTLQTSSVALQDFPAMEKIVDVTKLQILEQSDHAGDQARRSRSRTAACACSRST